LQAGAVIRSFTYGHKLISQRIVGGSLSFYQYDGHGSVRQLTNAGGAITDAYDYDAFGNVVYRSGTTPNDYLYTGEQFDANLGFYYQRARYMNPSSGRFWTMDSFAGGATDPISLHKYLYASADPLNRLDPSGRFSIGEEVAALDINGILSNIASLSLKGLIGGAIIGGADAALRGDDIIEGAIEGGLIGALLGPLGKVKFVGTALVALGTSSAIVGVANERITADDVVSTGNCLYRWRMDHGLAIVLLSESSYLNPESGMLSLPMINGGHKINRI
jgi:RHS repeat-associated protein